MNDDRAEELLDHLYKALGGDLPTCGYGDPEAAIVLVYGLLREFAAITDGRSRRIEALIGGSAGAQQIVLSTLDHGRLIEHGTSIWSSWLTARGRWVLWAVEQAGGIEGLQHRLDEEAGFPRHGSASYPPPECTDECWRVPEGWEPAPVEPSAVPPTPVVVACPGPSCSQYLYGMPHEHAEGS